MKKLYIFDMDGTLLPQTTAMLEIAAMTGHTEELKELERQLSLRQIDNIQFAKNVYDLWQTLPEEAVKDCFVKTPKLKNIERALEKIASHHGVPCLITSAPHFFANHFQAYGFDHIYAANYLCIKTGKLNLENILYPRDKPHIANELCSRLNVNFEESVAFGDSLSDVVLFQKLRETVSINGDHHIKDHAKHHYAGDDLLEALELVL